MKHTYLLSAALLVALAVPASAQVSNNDLGSMFPAVAAGTPALLGTTNTLDLANTFGRGVLCQLHQVSSSGTATVTFAIQSKDAASGLYDSLITSSSITTVNDSYIAVYPGMAVSSLPTGWTAQSLHLPATWRVQLVVGGTAGPAWNLSVGCNLLN